MVEEVNFKIFNHKNSTYRDVKKYLKTYHKDKSFYIHEINQPLSKVYIIYQFCGRNAYMFGAVTWDESKKESNVICPVKYKVGIKDYPDSIKMQNEETEKFLATIEKCSGSEIFESL